MSKKLKQKTSAILLASLLAISSIPMASSLSVYADDYSGGGTGGNGNVSGVYNGINYSNYGIRVYAIDSDGNIKTGNGSKYIIDLWNDSLSAGIATVKDGCNTICRFNGNATTDNVYIATFSTGINNATSNLKFINTIPDTTQLASIPAFASFANSTFNMSGITFKEWATSDVQNSKGGSAWNITLLYYGLTGISLEATDFLVIEPIMYAPIEFGDYGSSTFQYYSACTWYGFVKQLGDNKGANQMVTKASWGNGFTLDKDKPMAGLYPPDRKFTAQDKIGSVGDIGWGLHILKSEPIGEPDAPSDPIDTYDIDNDPTNPDKPETPKTTPDPDNPDTPIYDSTGEKTIIKTYVDLYTDADNSTYYTKAIDQGTYIEHNTSKQVVITDESDQNGGYEVVAWYTSQTDTTDTDTYNPDSLHGTDMLQTTDHTDQLHQSIGKEQFTLDGYTSITGISDTGSKSYTYIDKGTPNSLSNNSPQYTKTNNIQEPIEKDDTDKYNSDEYIDLGGDNTIVLLYVREHDWINTETFTGGGHGTGTGSSGGGNGTGTGTGSGGTPEQGELKIVKAYGIVNPDTYEITNDKDTATIENVTRNVHITSESGYRLAEYVYSTRGNEDDVVWNNITASSWGTLSNTDKDDTSFYLKGFIDGFSEPYGSALYSSKYAWTDTEQPVGSLSSTYNSDLTYPGTYGTGRLSGNTLTNYNSTIYFDMDDPDNTDTTDDVLYILFLKEDEVEYSADNFVIPESFITRHNDFATNNITVTGNLTGETTSYLFAKHKFKYSLPLVTGFSESNGDSITAWTDPYIIASISQTNTATTNGLISKWSKTELITYNPTDDTIDKRTSTDNSYELAVQKEQTTPSILSFTNANYSYTAYRKDDKPTLAQWKLEQLNSLSADPTYSMDTTGASLPLWIQGAEAFETIDDWNTNICNYSNNLVGNRQSNDTTSNFSLPLHFTDTKATATNDGVDLHNIPLIDTDTTVNGNNIIRKATATISGTSTDIQLKSEYISLFDVDVTQQVDYQIHYGSSKGSSYADDTKNVTNGTGTGTQSGGVQVMKKDNTIVDKYGQKHTIFISRKKKNMLHKRKR